MRKAFILLLAAGVCKVRRKCGAEESFYVENQEYSRGLNFLGAVALSMTDKIGRAIATKTGLNRTLAAALIQIGMNPGENMVHLRRMTGLTQPNTSRLVDALMRRGLVRRSFVPAGDPRSSALDL